ncbi:MAG: hypothetical protein ACRYGI_17820 [Janthinobacterium lividum]
MTKARIALAAMICAVGPAAALGRTEAATSQHVVHHVPKSVHTVGSATAGPATGGWSPGNCGREPPAPVVDTSTIDRYNASVDQVTTYEKTARSYNACVSREATAEQTAISNTARSRIDSIQAVSAGVQKRIAANFTSLTSALRDASPKLQGKSGRN